ncbi:MAG: hypothetical protein PUP93_21065 [Rhizonema sp. NSF051]|nr:hypothetical protein [Rhizonema sp. NSF051]
MSEHNQKRVEGKGFVLTPIPEDSLAGLVLEIEKIPKEYWSHLLQMIRLFRQSVTINSAPSDAQAKAVEEIQNQEPIKKAAPQKALSELLKSWKEEGDEQEQKESGEFLRQALDEENVSNLPLFL